MYEVYVHVQYTCLCVVFSFKQCILGMEVGLSLMMQHGANSDSVCL